MSLSSSSNGSTGSVPVAAPPMIRPRSSHRGPSIPMNRTGRVPAGRVPRFHRHVREHLGPERALGLLRGRAGRGKLFGDLLPDVLPQPAAARRREGVHPQFAHAVLHRDPDEPLPVRGQLDLLHGRDRDQEAAEIGALPLRVGLVGVPRAAAQARGHRDGRVGALRPGGVIVPVARLIGVFPAAAGVAGSIRSGVARTGLVRVLASTPTEHCARSFFDPADPRAVLRGIPLDVPS